MDEADEDADSVIHEASDEGEGEDEDDSLAGVANDMYAPAAAPAAAVAPAAAAAAALAAAAPPKAAKNKDSSDEECACAPGKESVKQKAAIKAK